MYERISSKVCLITKEFKTKRKFYLDVLRIIGYVMHLMFIVQYNGNMVDLIFIIQLHRNEKL
jgi:hypothetical protein